MAQRGIPFGQRPAGKARQAARRPRVLSVREAVEAANGALERSLGAAWIEGELTNLVLPRSGHAYFTLKDDAATLPAAMWASSVRRLRFRLEEGQRLRVYGRLGIYAAQGRFQLYAERAEPAGLGELALALEQLKRKLAAEGLFASDRTRPLPPWPRTVGVVTSPSGAAIHDIIKVVRRRMPTPILLAPAKVQGPEAAYELSQALRRLQRHPGVDLIIVGRGGGSSEDLRAFDNEGLARLVAACPIPVISAVGHEVDVSICDLVADRRAATPSQAAELAVPDGRALAERLDNRRRRLLRCLERQTLDLDARLQGASTRLERWGRGWVQREQAHLDELRRRLEQQLRRRLGEPRERLRRLAQRLVASDPRRRVADQRARLHELERRLVQFGKGLTSQLRPRLARAAGKLDALSPLAVLGRGYALVRDEAGQVLRDAADTQVGAALELQLAAGRLVVEVQAVDGADPETSP